MKVEAVDGKALVAHVERLVEQWTRDKYSLQVGLREVEFAFDEAAAAAMQLDPGISNIGKAERYLRAGILTPERLVEDDGTVHQVVEWDPTPVGYSGFMDCVTHSVVITDQGTFAVGRYPAMNIMTFSKVWQWFIHCRIEEGDKD